MNHTSDPACRSSPAIVALPPLVEARSRLHPVMFTPNAVQRSSTSRNVTAGRTSARIAQMQLTLRRNNIGRLIADLGAQTTIQFRFEVGGSVDRRRSRLNKRRTPQGSEPGWRQVPWQCSECDPLHCYRPQTPRNRSVRLPR
jgi:hypothetical protein